MAKGKRTCIICGTTYTYCPTCGNGNKDESWRYLYDTKQCNQIFDILSAYAHKHIKKTEARDQLKSLDIPKGMKFNSEIKKQIDEIMVVEPKIKDEDNKQIVKED